MYLLYGFLDFDKCIQGPGAIVWRLIGSPACNVETADRGNLILSIFSRTISSGILQVIISHPQFPTKSGETRNEFLS
jgi:hypothetical protein